MKLSIKEVKSRANGMWPSIFNSLKITVPEKGKHGPCPVCGGNDRFHFIDDHGGGEWHCRQCNKNHGDGFDLISRCLNIDTKAAVSEVSQILGNDTRSSTMPAKKENVTERAAVDIAQKVAITLSKTSLTPSSYLAGKGITSYTFPVLPDGKLFLPIVNVDGVHCGAQTIASDGSKCLIKGTRKKGAFIAPVPLPDFPMEIIIAEGLATAISVGILHSGSVVAALDAGNLKPVALALRERYPEAKIIIAADNDWVQHGELDEHGKPKRNTGKICGEEAAAACGGWLTLPPGETKTDWNDYLQLKGLEDAKAAFIGRIKNMGEGFRVLPGGVVLLDDEIAELKTLNARYTHTRIGSTHIVATVAYNDKGEKTHEFMDLENFKKLFLSDELIAKKNKGDAWLRWKGKNKKLGGVDFYPDPSKCPDDVYNLYLGWNVKPIPGDVSVYLNHVKEVICDNDEKVYSYVIGWMAHLIQRPDEKPSVAIVLKAIQGSGKGLFVQALRDILGTYHSIRIESVQSLTSKFNAILENKLLTFVDEATINSLKDADIIKGLASEKTAIIERKGIDKKEVPNFMRLIFASNSDKVLCATIRERRYLVLEPSEKYAQQTEYFGRLGEWMKNKGASYLLHYLLQVDISNFDPRRAPRTNALAKEILLNLPATESYIYSELCSDEPFRGQARIIARDEIDRFITYCHERGEQMTLPMARKRIGQILAKIGIKSTGRSDRGEGVYYLLPAKEDNNEWLVIRNSFMDHLNISYEVAFNSTAW